MLQDLLCITGSIDTNRGDVEGYNGFKNALLSAKEHNLEHEVLTGEQVNARFPGYNLPSNFMVQLCYAFLLHFSASSIGIMVLLCRQFCCAYTSPLRLCQSSFYTQPSSPTSSVMHCGILSAGQCNAEVCNKQLAVSILLICAALLPASGCFLTDDTCQVVACRQYTSHKVAFWRRSYALLHTYKLHNHMAPSSILVRKLSPGKWTP